MEGHLAGRERERALPAGWAE